MPKIKLDDKEYDVASLSQTALGITEHLKMLDLRILEAKNMHSILTKAKRAYITDLKSEMISVKAGLDLEL